jgi:hypothetical protein
MCISENFSSSLGTLLPHHILVALRFKFNACLVTRYKRLESKLQLEACAGAILRW